MRTLTTAVLAAVATFLILPDALAAQEEMPEGEKREDATYYEIFQIDFKPGKQDTALALFEQHAMPAYRESEYPPPEMMLVHQSGSWDLTVIYEFQRGPSTLAWEITPERASYQRHLVKQAGGPEQAREMSETYNSFVAREKITFTYEPARFVIEQEQ